MPEPSPDWWRHAVIYQVYPRSFSDSNGDGVGDLRGVVDRLDHLVELGVDGLWLSPFYTSPQADGGYDVADYRDVDPSYGNLRDFDKLIAEAHERGLRVIVDLVPNHTSAAHPWFLSALAAKPGSRERERYIFRQGRGSEMADPPNNWSSAFGGPAWTRVSDGWWYLHLFDATQPDLNWENPDIHAEFVDILRFWLERGVDGFRVDVATGLIKRLEVDANDDEQPGRPFFDTNTATAPMWDQDGVHEIYRAWRRVVDDYPGQRILVAEAWVRQPERLANYVRADEMHQAFNFDYLYAVWTAESQRVVIERSLDACGSVGAPTTWVLSNHDVVRHASRLGFSAEVIVPTGIGEDDPQPDPELGLRRALAATALMLALPGSAYLYQGEELGLPEHTTMPDSARMDPTWRRSNHTVRGRDGCRVPLPWSADAPAYGFAHSGASWLPQPSNWRELALDRQRGMSESTYEFYRTALRIRAQYRLGEGVPTWLDAPGDALSFRNGPLHVLTNFGAQPVALPTNLSAVLSSQPLPATGSQVPADTTVWAVDTATIESWLTSP